MKRAPLLLCAGTVAGFVGVLGLHSRQAPAGPSAGASPSSSGASASASGGTGVAGPRAPGAVRSVVGPEVQYGYGVLDVKVTSRGKHITDVSVPLLQTAEPTSQQISTEAIAMLRGEALSAQSGRIDAISGATYTSEAYIQSLQAALDKLPSK
jgi:Na+-translocating ferredoxin:NAD+ oxidoreductase RnfG subunit